MIDLVLAAAMTVAPMDTTTLREQAATRPTRSAARVPGRWKPFERCVAQRESHDTPTARNATSSASGTYQFLDNSWRKGLAFMVADRLKDHGMKPKAAKTIRITLQGKHIATWPAIYQRIGFNEVIARGGDHHWRLAGSTCEQYR